MKAQLQMKKILFVDDEPRILEGIKRVVRPMRDRWHVEFATSGPDALQLLRQQQFDVVVSDMRMPGMDGAELLGLVREQFPEVVRIVLSGYSEQEMILKSVKTAHQYLSKPCDSKTLVDTIENVCSLHENLPNESLRRVVSRMESLPSLPTLYQKIIEEASSEDASVLKIAQIISKDVGMTAKVLQLVNSGFFSFCQHVTDMVQAVNLLGLDTIKGLVLSIHVFSEFQLSKTSALSVTELWRHSLCVAVFSRAIASAEGLERQGVEDAFIGGILHDVGKLILAGNFAKEYGMTNQLSTQEKIPLHEAEDRIFRANHCAVGGYFASLWGFPHPIVRAIRFHHEARLAVEACFSTLSVVGAANLIEQESARTEREGLSLGLDGNNSTVGDQVRLWRDVCKNAPAMEIEHG